MIPFCKKLNACILNGYVEADHDRVAFDEDITCAGGDTPIVGMFTWGLIIGKFPKFEVREGSEWFSLYSAQNLQYSCKAHGHTFYCDWCQIFGSHQVFVERIM